MSFILSDRFLLTLLLGACFYVACGVVVTAVSWREVYPASRATYLALARQTPEVPQLPESKIRLWCFVLGCATWPWLVAQELAGSLLPPGR